MDASFFRRVKWPYVVLSALFLFLGIDIGLRLGARPPAAPALPHTEPAPTRPDRATPSPAPPDPRDNHAAARADDPPSTSRERSERTPPPKSAGLVGPTLPPPTGKVADLIHAAEEANAKGDKPTAAAKLKEAAAAATEPARKEELALREMWTRFELGQTAEVKRIAEAIAAHPVREENQRAAEELLAKLASKGK